MDNNKIDWLSVVDGHQNGTKESHILTAGGSFENSMHNHLLKKAYELYDMNRTEFSKHTNIPYKTLEGWEQKGLSGQGELLINSLIKIKEQELILQRRNIIEAYEIRTVEIYDDRILKYKDDDPKDLANELLLDIGIEVYEIEEVIINPKEDNENPHMIIKFTTKLGIR